MGRERLARLIEQSARIRRHVEQATAEFNGVAGQPHSFDLLHGLLEEQSYRLAYWRTASHEINYRRFFDVNTLVGLRMEDPGVFDATHTLVAELLADGSLSGLRIDHPDGLYDPAEYFERLQGMWQSVRKTTADGAPGPPRFTSLAEKILTAGEELPEGWKIAGTTGYQFVSARGRRLRQSGRRAAPAAALRSIHRADAAVCRGRLRSEEADRARRRSPAS